MASTVYYGKSTTAAGVKTKQVIIQVTNEELVKLQSGDFFKAGDLLIVHFVHACGCDSPTLSVYIRDTNNETSSATDDGLGTYIRSPERAVTGTWDSGEVIAFVYTLDANTNIASWIMVDGGFGKEDVYGAVKLVTAADLSEHIDIDTSGALSLNGVKYLIQNLKGSNLTYNNQLDGSVAQTLIGTIQLQGEGVEDVAHGIYIPTPQVLKNVSELHNDAGYITSAPTKTSQLTNDSGFITSTALSGYATQSWVGSNYALKSSVPSISGLATTSNLTSLGNDIRTWTTNTFVAKNQLPTYTFDTLMTIEEIKSKNLLFGKGKKNFPGYNSGNGTPGIGSRPTDAKATTVDAGQLVVRIACQKTGWYPVGILGWNLEQGDAPSGYFNSNARRNPENVRVWSLFLSGTNICCQLTSDNADDNCVYLKVHVLYKKV